MNILYLLPLVIGTWEWVIIAVVILLLFGGKKGLGKGVRNFKDGVKGIEDEVDEIKKDLK